MSNKILDNGTVLTLGLVGAVAAIGVAAKRGVYGSRSTSIPLDRQAFKAAKQAWKQEHDDWSPVMDEMSPQALNAYMRLIEVSPMLMESVYELFSEEDTVDVTKQMAQFLRGEGFTVIGRGGSRVVVKLDARFAAKVAAWEDGVKQNRIESDTWRRINERVPGSARMFMPVHHLDGEENVLLTEVAKPCKKANAKQCEDKFYVAKKKLDEHETTRNISDAAYIFNWGFHGGDFKLLDYGV